MTDNDKKLRRTRYHERWPGLVNLHDLRVMLESLRRQIERTIRKVRRLRSIRIASSI